MRPGEVIRCIFENAGGADFWACYTPPEAFGTGAFGGLVVGITIGALLQMFIQWGEKRLQAMNSTPPPDSPTKQAARSKALAIQKTEDE